MLGGLGMLLGALNPPFAPHWLLPVSSFGLFLLVAVASPANIYMWTHNAPGPLIDLTEEELETLPGKVLPQHYYVIRGAQQVFLLATCLGLAFHHY